jgi:hypothetical protein
MNPLPGVVEKKLAETLFEGARKWWNRHAEEHINDQKQIAELRDRLDEKAAFERKLAQFKCSPEDDNIYWKDDGSGMAICPLCINGREPLFTPLIHGVREGAYYCRLHEQHFETAECRQRLRNYVPRSPRYCGPNSWMAN